MRSIEYSIWWAPVLITVTLLGLSTVDAASISGGLLAKLTPPNTRIQQCREGCLEKFAIKESICQQRPECSLCWDECAKPPPPKINKSILETWALRTVSMLQQDSLVLVDVAWAPLNTPNQCLVTWEVSGGGLMGNLLTESSSVQLSLWPDTKYRVQVTCKNKKTGAMSRSLPLTIDTIEAVPPQERSELTSSTDAAPATASNHPTKKNKGELHREYLKYYESLSNKWNRPSSSDVTINKINPLDQSEYSSLPIATLSELQEPLLLCAIGGVIVLAIVLSFYVWLWNGQGSPSDKKLLIDDDSSSTAATSIAETNHFGGGITNSCNTTTVDPSIYSRTVHVLTV